MNGVDGRVAVMLCQFFELLTYIRISEWFLCLDKSPPYHKLTLQADGNFTHTGSSKLLFNWLSEKLDFTYVY